MEPSSRRWRQAHLSAQGQGRSTDKQQMERFRSKSRQQRGSASKLMGYVGAGLDRRGAELGRAEQRLEEVREVYQLRTKQDV